MPGRRFRVKDRVKAHYLSLFALICASATVTVGAPAIAAETSKEPPKATEAKKDGSKESSKESSKEGKDASKEAKLAPVLDPNKYFGKAKLGYAAAQLCPEICAKLFCYCGCDETDEHDTLLDCFTTDHGVDCHICQEEALIALKMKRDGKSLAEIQQAVDKAFEKQYPFDEVSAKFQKYKDSRLYKAAAGASSAKSKSGMSSLTKEDLKTGLPSDISTKSANSKSQTSDSKAKSSGASSARTARGGCCSGKSKKQ
jgi:hypothetical protein